MARCTGEAMSPSGALEDLVSPQPLVAPHLDEAAFREPTEGRREVGDDVLWMVRVDLAVEAREEEAARPERAPDVVDGGHRVRQVLEDVHRGHDVEGAGGQRRRLQVDELRGEAARGEAPAREVEERRADVGERDL